jgi:hypothetical protein
VSGVEGTILVVTATPTVGDASAAAASVALAGRARGPGKDVPLLIDLGDRAAPYRPAILAADGARAMASAVDGLDGWSAVARGALTVAFPSAREDASLEAPLELVDAASPVVIHAPGPRFRPAVSAAQGGGRAHAVLVQAAGSAERALLSVLSIELRRERLAHRIWLRPPGGIGARRALAGLDPGGELRHRATRTVRLLASQAGQAVPAVMGLVVVALVAALFLVAVGGAVTAKGRAQRAADLAALSAARSMRDDFPRLFVPALRADGTPNPEHLSKADYEARATAAAREGASRNGLGARLSVVFPDGDSVAPLRVRVEAKPRIEIAGQGSGERTHVAAEAAVAPPTAPVPPPGGTTMATGGGYSGPLVMRQGKAMRPDVAAAFDRLAAAAARDGVSLVINSAYRSDAEQARLFEANPDPRMVAPPGTSLHRCGTELDLGPSTAYGWLAANARKFGFVQRYSWEAWHYGYVEGPEPCSAAGDQVGGSEPGGRPGDGRAAGGEGLPGFVPAQYRDTLLGAAARHDVSASLLAAQIMAESNFNPAAVSSAGAQGIAQFMPGTAAAYGLSDPFDAEQAIDAQARLMADLLGQFGRVELALAAYNAGPAPVAACGCVPAYPETQAYVAKILAMLDGAGDLAAPAPALEVRLVG